MIPTQIILHHTVTPRDQSPGSAERGINRTHQERFNFKSSLGWYVAYQYIIYGNGELRQYRKDTEPGAHTAEAGINSKSIAVCLTGNFDTDLPSPAQQATLTKFLLYKTAQHGIRTIRNHRYYSPYKSCPGRRIPDDWGYQLIKGKYMNPNVRIIINKGEGIVGYVAKDMAQFIALCEAMGKPAQVDASNGVTNADIVIK